MQGPRSSWSNPPSDAGQPAGAAGFTLFEVLLALLLMALLATLALPTPHRPAGPMTLRLSAYGVLALLQEARTAAINGGRPSRALVDPAAGVVDGGGRRLELPAGIAIALAGRDAPEIDFAPDGTSTGGTILLQAASSRVVVAVEAATGAIHLAP